MVPLLTHLDGRVAHFADGQSAPIDVIVLEGDPGDKLYVLVHGRVAISRRDVHGVDRRIAVQEDGDFFGEIALLRPVPRIATVTTVSPTIVLTLSRNQFLDVVRVQPELLATLERAADRRLAPIGGPASASQAAADR